MGYIRVVGDAYHLYAKMSCYIHCKQVYASPFLRINNTIFCLYLAYNLHGFSWDQAYLKPALLWWEWLTTRWFRVWPFINLLNYYYNYHWSYRFQNGTVGTCIWTCREHHVFICSCSVARSAFTGPKSRQRLLTWGMLGWVRFAYALAIHFVCLTPLQHKTVRRR